jgi:hypothetical protein
MHMRRVTALTAVLTMALALGLAGCAQKINGTAVMAAGADTGQPTTSSTRGKATTTAKAPSSPAKPTATDKPAGKVKIGTKKKTESSCEILSPDEVAKALGSKPAPTPGCVQTTADPLVVILLMVTLADHDTSAREFEVAGNTAYEIKEGSDCSVMIMLTDDPDEITPALLASITPLDEVNTCDLALKLATAAFNKIPNA